MNELQNIDEQLNDCTVQIMSLLSATKWYGVITLYQCVNLKFKQFQDLLDTMHVTMKGIDETVKMQYLKVCIAFSYCILSLVV